MSADGFWSSLLAVAAILIVSLVLGWFLAGCLVPKSARFRLERLGWSVALAASWIALNVCVSFTLKLRPGWLSFLGLAAIGLGLARRFALARDDQSLPNKFRSPLVSFLLLLLTAFGVAAYLARGLSEPMWSNDFLAVWGLKGKTIFGDGAIPQRLFRWPEFEFSNPDYPLGLPLLYAGLAFLLGRWEDHATALLFPFFQIGTLLVLVGWLKRRGASNVLALAASALVANFSFLYSAWLTGMAEVAVSFGFLLVAIALCDAIDQTDPGATRRLFLAALLTAATKNEGEVLIAIVLVLIALRSVRQATKPPWGIVAAIFAPGLVCYLTHRLVLGSHRVRSLDLSLLWRPGLIHRIRETLHQESIQLLRPNWPALAAVAGLLLLARYDELSKRILFLGFGLLAIYLFLPVLCPFGPEWLVHWTLGRIIAAVVPLAAVGIGAGWIREKPVASDSPGLS